MNQKPVPSRPGWRSKNNTRPLAKKAFKILRKQVTIIKKYIENIINKKYIRPSISFYVIPVLIIKKPNSGLKIYVNYKALNSLIIKNRNVPPLIRKTLSRLYKARVYLKFDIIATFNKIQI